mmetsp:Transcript_35502/g.102270  ORF Transcript_35502/g.102270 Transcript_35502/m.102270 type:complete len:159 (-) Transcript_35502:90-566(-)
MPSAEEIQAARDKLRARLGDTRTGGKGSARRTKAAKHTSHAADDKQLQAQLKRLGVNAIPGIEEVNMFKEDGTVIHFNAPKVQASVASNTFVVSGHADHRKLEELLPGILNQLGPDNLMNLKRIAEGFSAGAGKPAASSDDNDDIPDVGENFEEVSKS